MTQTLLNENEVISPGAISKEEDSSPTAGFIINPPPPIERCFVCGRHFSELKPFGGPGDPLLGDFSGHLLIKRRRRMGPYDWEAEKAWKEAEKATKGVPQSVDPHTWLITKYGKEKAEQISMSVEAWAQIGSGWECRDCCILDDDEYFEKLQENYQKRENE